MHSSLTTQQHCSLMTPGWVSLPPRKDIETLTPFCLHTEIPISPIAPSPPKDRHHPTPMCPSLQIHIPNHHYTPLCPHYTPKPSSRAPHSLLHRWAEAARPPSGLAGQDRAGSGRSGPSRHLTPHTAARGQEMRPPARRYLLDASRQPGPEVVVADVELHVDVHGGGSRARRTAPPPGGAPAPGPLCS